MKSNELSAADFETDLSREIELYRTLSEKYGRQARRRGAFALVFCTLSLLGMLALVALAILARRDILQIQPLLFFAYMGLAILCLLIGLFFFGARHDSCDLALECTALAKEKEETLQKKLEQKRAKEAAARQAAVRVTEILPKIPMSRAHKAASVLRKTSSILSALYAIAIPVASIAALCKSKPKKEKRKN